MYSRALKVHLAQLRQTQFSQVNRIYYVKNVYYGDNCDTYDYSTVKVSFKQRERTTEKAKKYTKSDFAVQRARERVYRIIEANKKRFTNRKRRSVFFTLTTKDQIKDHKESNKKIKVFIRRLNEYCGYKIKYIIVPELHKSNAIHYHGVFFNLPYIPVRILSRDIWKYGYTDIQLPRKIRSIASYLSKYLTKDFQENTPKGTKTYFCSRGIVLPTTEFTTEHPQDIMYIADVRQHNYYIKTKYKLCRKS